MVTIQLDEELLTALVFAAAQSSCGFNQNILQENQLWHLHCCDYNEPVYEVAKQINIDDIEDESYRAYFQEVKAKGDKYYSEVEENEKQTEDVVATGSQGCGLGEENR
ncbi:TPA: hypothetical protein U1C31_001146 [Streptococcus suis]|nr:hypothetical protein [Streptococcus suis]